LYNSQIWLNQLMDACHLTYIKNLEKEKEKEKENPH
jgi:hypothetical protein